MGIHVFVVDWLCPLLVSSFCGGQWGKILVPLLWGGVPRRGGVVGATQNHPVRLRLTPLQRRGMDLGPLQRGGGICVALPLAGAVGVGLVLAYRGIVYVTINQRNLLFGITQTLAKVP